MNDSSYKFEVSDTLGRIDSVLVSMLEEVSRNRIQKLIRSGRVKVDGQLIRKPSYKLLGGEILEIYIPKIKETELIAEHIPLDIVYEDHNLVVVNKAAGMVVHPSVGHDSGTLVNAILAHAPDIEGIGGEMRPGVVHRLDKDTSGIIILAKNDRTHQFLQNQFIERTTEKIYYALVDGIPKSSTGRVEADIARSKKDRKKMAVFPGGQGREAVTYYRILEQFDKHAYLEVKPETGRTHQIRVHLAFIGIPIAGDRVYGRKKPTIDIKRHFLHAAELRLLIPGETRTRSFLAKLAPDLETVLNNIRR